MKTIASKSAHQQRGAALLVAMVMIFMLSIMGVSAMRGSTLERRMASNSIQANTVFQASDSSTEIALNDNSNLQAAWMSATNEVNITTDMKRTSEMESSVVLKYVGDGAAAGTSIGLGASNFVALRYVAEGQANIAAVRSGAVVHQGAYRIVPAN